MFNIISKAKSLITATHFSVANIQTQIFGQIHHEKSLHMSKTIRLRVNRIYFFALVESVYVYLCSRRKCVVHKENEFKPNFTCGIHTHLHTYSTVNMIVTVISFSVLQYQTMSNPSFLKTHIMKKCNQIHIAEYTPNSLYRCTLMPKLKS